MKIKNIPIYFSSLINMIMRFYEFKTIQPIKPATPQQAKINTLKQHKERATTALKTERDTQKNRKRYSRTLHGG
jgi:hypothetical protein